MTISTTARLGLPLLAAGQAQKEIAHNEALVRADILIQPVVEATGMNDPPVAPEPGQAWILGSAPTGAWSGRALAIAAWTDGGWRFVSAMDGLHGYDRTTGLWARFIDGAWDSGTLAAAVLRIDGDAVVGPRASPIADPEGGATIDEEARNTIASILAALRGHGLISS